MTKFVSSRLLGASLVAVLAGCASSGGRAPVSDINERKTATPSAAPVAQAAAASAKPARKAARPANDWRPQTYVVQKGDTLYSIAFNYGLDYHDIAGLNNIQDANVIRVGQELRLFPAESAPVAPVAEAKPAAVPVKDQPKVAKTPYSGKAAEAEKAPEPAAKPEAAPADGEEDVAVDGEVEWGVPTNGKVVAGFSESANRKGIDIAGKMGQPVLASAAGKVVYSGSGLRGYGKLVIIKHNNTYLSAYAHNSNILVKEGQTVTKGQKIAEMGNTDASQVQLHFEIRKLGKPVDPAKYLSIKS